jgi:hypothetical protein
LSEYFSNAFNVNDFIMIIIFWIYAGMRLFTEKYQSNFLLVNKFEFTDAHLEMELVIDMLQHADNTTYFKNDQSATASRNYEMDYNKMEDTTLTIMVVFNVFLIFQAFVKVCYYLQAFEHLGNLVKMLTGCIVDVFYFMIFFFMWIIFFSCMFQIVGLEIFQDDYFSFNIYITYLIYTYRNAIGDLDPPAYNFWLSRASTRPLLS